MGAKSSRAVWRHRAAGLRSHADGRDEAIAGRCRDGTSGDHRPEDFEAIPLAGTRKQPNPLGTLAVSLTGLNVAQFAIPPAHALASAERATGAVELYWQALLRDVPFFEYRDDTSHRGVLAATAELGRLQAGPWRGARLTPSTLFRGSALYLDDSDPSNRSGRHVVPPGVLVGPYVSQFLLRDIPYGTQYISARIRAPTQDSEFLTDYSEWLNVQNGNLSGRAVTFQSTPRYIATGRDLAEYVHGGTAAFWAAALLLAAPATGAVPGFGTPLNPSNPYLRSRTQTGAAGTFALGYFQGLLPLAVSRAIRAAYWQKFFVQRALRPEAYGGLVHHKLAHDIDAYPIHSALTGSEAVARSFAKNGSYLLPHTYPEGAPLHSGLSCRLGGRRGSERDLAQGLLRRGCRHPRSRSGFTRRSDEIDPLYRPTFDGRRRIEQARRPLWNWPSLGRNPLALRRRSLTRPRRKHRNRLARRGKAHFP